MKKHPFQHNVTVSTDGNLKGKMSLNIDNNLQNEHLIGVRVTRPNGGLKSINGNPLINQTAFGASFLTVGQKNTIVARDIPLEEIARVNDNGYWYKIDVPNMDMKTSFLKCSDTNTIVTGEDYQFMFKVMTAVG